jgi:hypothetical protein
VNTTGNVHCPNLNSVLNTLSGRTPSRADVRSVGRAPVLKLHTCTLQFSLNFRFHKA